MRAISLDRKARCRSTVRPQPSTNTHRNEQVHIPRAGAVRASVAVAADKGHAAQGQQRETRRFRDGREQEGVLIVVNEAVAGDLA
jgi:hypothetical protein